MEAGAYSTLKAAYHTDRIDALRRGLAVIPVEIQLILSDLCNHDCHFCAYRASDGLSSEQFADAEGNKNPKRMMEKAKAVSILEDAASLGVKSIIFTGGGEPTVHPDHESLFRKALGLGLDCALNTNGDVLRPGVPELLTRFAYVRFSVDAGTDEEYSEIRKVPRGRYFKVLHNIEMVARRVHLAGSSCVVGAGYVVTPKNWLNLDAGVRRLRDSGVGYVRLASMQSTKGAAAYDANEWRNARQAVKDVKYLETETFKVIDLFDAAMGRTMDVPECGMQHFVLYVGANLKVYRCCYTAYTALGECGDLSGMSLANYLVSLDRAKSLESFDARECSTCPLAEKNAVIAYLAGTPPMHVNFV